MRKFAAVLMLLLAAACAQVEAKTEDAGRLNVLTSLYPAYIMAINVCHDVPGVNVANLTPTLSGCLHDYSLTAGDMKKIADADIFIANGGGAESFLKDIAGRYPSKKIVTLAEGIPLIGSNPHVWVSVSGAIEETRNLGRAMEAFDPGHKELYRKNTAAYIGKVEALRSRMRSELALFKGKKIITFHEAFPYFAKEFGFEIAAVVEREPGNQPSAKELAATVDLIRQSGVKSLFSEPQYPAVAAGIIAKEAGAVVYMLDPAVTGPDDPDAYLDIMKKNLATLKKALS